MRRLSTVAVIAATMSIAAFAPSASADATAPPADEEQPIGGIGLRLTEAPVSAADDPRARVYIVDHLAPGTVIERGIEVSNTSASSQHVVLYAAGASIEDGTFVGAAGDTPNELSSWTSVTPTEMDVPADGTLAATVTVAVPTDAAPGEQYGVVWAEVRSKPATEGGVVQVSRVGIRLYLSVGPGNAPAADFTIDTLSAARSADGLPMVSASVHNTGGRALDMSGTLSLSNGPGGLSAGPFPVQTGRTLALGDTQSVHVTLDERLPAGPWDASITLESGMTERTVEATITFPEQGTTAPVDTQTPVPTKSWLAPWVVGVVALLGVVAILAACGVLIVARRQRRRRLTMSRWAPPSGVPVNASSST